jgi:hypothetical protein
MLVFRMATSKAGVSISEMRRDLEINDYKTVWVMSHKVRKAVANRDSQHKLAGLVKIDGSFFGSKPAIKRECGAKCKERIIIAISTWTDKKGREQPGFAHAFAVQDIETETIEADLRRLGIQYEEIEPLSSSIRSDGWKSYQAGSKKSGMVHHRAVLRTQRTL